ncbi:MAG: TetR family transcriptional regulator [Clostridia bacterium]|jgi:AcrR family transcriptional regulator|nr:TetR family transcriptional regulator [Clostridia bacterium]
MGHREIIEAAVQLFKKNGYPTTSMQDIANELGCTKAAIYYYFTGKEDLLLAIMNLTMTIAERNLAQVLAQELDPPQTLKAILKSHITSIFEEQAYITVFFFDKHYLSPENLHKINLRRRGYEQEIARVVEQGMKEGYLEQVEVQPIVYAMLGMCNWMIQWYQPAGRLKTEEIAQIYWELIYQGIIKKS